MSKDLNFLEIEHKFVVELGYDPQPLLKDLHARNPEKFIRADVQDTYFLVRQAPQAVYRHRIDRYLQQLTMKSLGADTEVRTEVNLDLGSSAHNQIEGVRAFLAPLGILWQGTLQKEIEAFYFADAELVFYTARYSDREVRCIEIEARRTGSLEAARAILAGWEKTLGLNTEARSKASLLELLVVPTLNPELQQRIRGMRI